MSPVIGEGGGGRDHFDKSFFLTLRVTFVPCSVSASKRLFQVRIFLTNTLVPCGVLKSWIPNLSMYGDSFLSASQLSLYSNVTPEITHCGHDRLRFCVG